MREGTESCFAAGIPLEALDMQCPAALSAPQDQRGHRLRPHLSVGQENREVRVLTSSRFQRLVIRNQGFFRMRTVFVRVSQLSFGQKWRN